LWQNLQRVGWSAKRLFVAMRLWVMCLKCR
jgi:hypothetical protein